MNTETLNKVIREQIERCENTLCKKADEYAVDDDRLHNFKVAAGIQKCLPTTALGGMGKSYHFNPDGKATDFHECGHVYASKYDLPMAFSADVDRWYRETGCVILKSPHEAWSEAYAAYYTHADDLPPYIRRYFDDGEWKTNSGSKVLSLEEWQRRLRKKQS